MARKWAYMKKKIRQDQAKVLIAGNNFHGRTINIISFSTSDDSRRDFGPFNPGYRMVPYNDLEHLEEMVKEPDVAAFMVEPIQGEAGVIVPDEGYLKKAHEICKRHNVLFIADEIQTGMGRTGKLLCVHHEEVQPDIVILGKALSAGFMPVSAVLANDEIMLCIQPGEHGSTFGGNPLGARIAIESTRILIEEGMAENADHMGEIFRQRMRNINNDYIELVRGKGLLNAIVISDHCPLSAYEICKKLKEKGLLAKQTHGKVIRFAPPLIINEEQLNECCDIIESTIKEID